jgi:hypothetical protein
MSAIFSQFRSVSRGLRKSFKEIFGRTLSYLSALVKCVGDFFFFVDVLKVIYEAIIDA